jgi:hypothetical protein
VVGEEKLDRSSASIDGHLAGDEDLEAFLGLAVSDWIDAGSDESSASSGSHLDQADTAAGEGAFVVFPRAERWDAIAAFSRRFEDGEVRRNAVDFAFNFDIDVFHFHSSLLIS